MHDKTRTPRRKPHPRTQAQTLIIPKDPRPLNLAVDLALRREGILLPGHLLTFASRFHLTLDVRGVTFPNHRHPHCELGLVARGRMAFADRQGRHLLGPGDLILVPRGSLHTREILAPSAIYGFFLHLEALSPAALSALPNQGLLLAGPLPAWQNLLTEIHLTAQHHGPYAHLLLKERLMLLLVTCLERLLPAHSVQHGLAPPPGSGLLQEMLKRIHADVGKVAAATLARDLDLSERHLNRLCHKLLGRTLHGYIREIRLASAYADLMRERQVKVRELAHRYGFSQEAYFIACFRRAYGKTPMALRRDPSLG